MLGQAERTVITRLKSLHCLSLSMCLPWSCTLFEQSTITAGLRYLGLNTARRQMFEK